MERLLRASVATQLLAMGPKHSSGVETFRNTAVSAVLRDRHAASMRSLVRSLMEDNYPAYAQLVNGAQVALYFAATTHAHGLLVVALMLPHHSPGTHPLIIQITRHAECE